MNKIKSIIKGTVLTATLTIATASCGYLDKRPENVIPKDQVDYSDKSLMYQPVSGVYSRFADVVSSWSLYGFYVIHDDQLLKGLSSDTDQADLNDFKNFNYTNCPTSWFNDGAWTYFYDVIIASNSALEALDNFRGYLTDSEDIQKNEQYKAEVRFLRAYTYLFMTRLWGDIPIFTNNDDVDGIYRSSREKVYTFIITELDGIKNTLPSLHPSQTEHLGAATKYAALALQAKASADINDWETVFSATETIINENRFDLYPDFYQLFKKPGQMCEESIFEVQFSDFGSSDGIVKAGGYAANVQGPNGNWIDNEAGIPIYGGWGFLPASDLLERRMIERGETVRKTTTLLYSAQTEPDGEREYNGIMYPYRLTPSGDQIFSTQFKAYNGKTYVPSSQMTEGRPDWGCYNNMRMLRFAEVLLLNAEARIHKGMDADEPFNRVRKRAQMKELDHVTLQQVYDERDMELALEWGERYYDLTRTGRAAAELPGYTEDLRFYPVPRTQIDLNPNLAGEILK